MSGATKTAGRLGIMGGTFDPIHNGHLIVAEEARHAFALDEVVFLPTGAPWQKSEREVTPADERYLMCVLATAQNPYFSVSRRELERPGPTYTVDTLRDMRADLGERARLYFITGADAILQILMWKDPDDAMALATFIAATRPGHDLAGLAGLDASVRGRIEVLEVPGVAISSTLVRERVRAGLSVRYLVPDPVAAFIAKRHLYCAA